MPETRPTGEQLRFVSAFTGEHNLDTYLEAAQKGGRNLSDLLDDLFDAGGVFKGSLFEFRVDPATLILQTRVGIFADSVTGWVNTGQYVFRARGTHATATDYKRLDFVEYQGEMYLCSADHTSSSAVPGASFTRYLAKPAIGGSDMLFSPDATFDIGKSGATRPRDIFTSRHITSGGNTLASATGDLGFSTRSKLISSADGVLTLLNSAATDFTRLTFGGTTSSFPALKRSGNSIETRLADDSAFTVFRASSFVTNNGTRISDSGDGVLVVTNNASTALTGLQLGPSGTSYVRLKPDAAGGLQLRLADDSAFASFRAASLIFTSGNALADTATTAEIWGGTATNKASTPANLAASMAFQTLTDAAVVAWNVANGYNARVTLTAARQIGTPTNLIDGQVIVLNINPGTFTPTWTTVWDFGFTGTPVLPSSVWSKVTAQYNQARNKLEASVWRGV